MGTQCTSSTRTVALNLEKSVSSNLSKTPVEIVETWPSVFLSRKETNTHNVRTRENSRHLEIPKTIFFLPFTIRVVAPPPPNFAEPMHVLSVLLVSKSRKSPWVCKIFPNRNFKTGTTFNLDTSRQKFNALYISIVGWVRTTAVYSKAWVQGLVGTQPFLAQIAPSPPHL